MALPSSTNPWVGQALIQVLGQAAGTKAQAAEALATLQAGPVSTVWIFNALDQMNDAIGRFDRFKAVAGLNAHATAQVPGYAGTLTTDIATTQAAIQQCIDWIIANFPKDTTNTWPLAFQWGVNGARVPRSFTTAQTAGLQTRLQTLIATVV